MLIKLLKLTLWVLIIVAILGVANKYVLQNKLPVLGPMLNRLPILGQ